MSTAPENTDTAEQASLDAATAWAREHIEDGPHVVSGPIVALRAPYNFEPGQDGRTERRVDLPEEAVVRMPAGAPLARLTWKTQFNGAGPAEYMGDGLRLHPRLACEGEEATRVALRERVEELREQAAGKLDRAARYETLLAREWEVAWPDYWPARDGQLVGVKASPGE